MKINPNKHYVNKSHTKHYYKNIIFTNNEWLDFTSGNKIKGILITVTDKHRTIPEKCDRWYNQDSYKTSIAKPCPNKPFYRADHNNLYFCKYCAREVYKINPLASFKKVVY